MFKIKLKLKKKEKIHWENLTDWTGFKFINDYGKGTCFTVGKAMSDGVYSLIEGGEITISSYRVESIREHLRTGVFIEV